MGVEDKLDHCLSDHELRVMIEERRLVTDLKHAESTKRIQPDSLEPVLGTAAFWLRGGPLTPSADKSIYRMLVEAKPSERPGVNLEKEPLRPGRSYLVKLEEQMMLVGTQLAKNSPKSSGGRTFMNCRLNADYNSGREIVRALRVPTLVDLWLLLEPLKFESLLAPGLTLSQLRIFSGPNAALQPCEIRELHKKNALMLKRNEEGIYETADLVFTDTGTELTADLRGLWTGGIACLKARDNAPVLDFSRIKEHDITDYFHLIPSEERKIEGVHGDCFLLASEQVLRIPRNLNAELDEHFARAFEGTAHKAGFVDPGFFGQLVFEPTLTSKGVFTHGMPLGNLRWFRNGNPQREYGEEELGSNYKGQLGPRVAKYFVPPDWELLTKKYKTLFERVLMVERTKVEHTHFRVGGLEPRDGECGTLPTFVENMKKGFFDVRHDREHDPLAIQVIPYLVIIGPDHTVFHYTRSDDIKKSGAKDLHSRVSIGLGGHIIEKDCVGYEPEWLTNCISRKALTEEVSIRGRYTIPQRVGSIYSEDNPSIDPFHFAIVYVTYTEAEVVPVGSSIQTGSFVSYEKLREDIMKAQHPELNGCERLVAETWTNILLKHIDKLWKDNQRWREDFERTGQQDRIYVCTENLK